MLWEHRGVTQLDQDLSEGALPPCVIHAECNAWLQYVSLYKGSLVAQCLRDGLCFLACIKLTLVAMFTVYGLCSLHCQHVFSKWRACVVYGSFIKTATPSSDTTVGASASFENEATKVSTHCCLNCNW